jgi:hypothetical protein
MKLIRLISSLATAVFISSLAMATDRSNVVIVYIDDMGWKGLSCYGSTFYKTPVIDQLAAEGTRFTDAYAASQICSPSRRALLTGKYSARSNFTDLPGSAAATGKKLIDPIQEDIMPNSEVLFSEIFQAAGYYTGFLGKWHLEDADVGEVSTEHGFDVWDEINSEGAAVRCDRRCSGSKGSLRDVENASMVRTPVQRKSWSTAGYTQRLVSMCRNSFGKMTANAWRNSIKQISKSLLGKG